MHNTLSLCLLVLLKHNNKDTLSHAVFILAWLGDFYLVHGQFAAKTVYNFYNCSSVYLKSSVALHSVTGNRTAATLLMYAKLLLMVK
jgi:hypothetical protein